MGKDDQQQARPNCYACLHFYITHEPAHPYGCKAMGFKTLQNPAVAVLSSSGMRCQLFTPKSSHKVTTR